MSQEEDRRRMTHRQARALDPQRARRNAAQFRGQTREGGAVDVNERGRFVWVPDPEGPLTQNDRGANINLDPEVFAVVPGSPPRVTLLAADDSIVKTKKGVMAAPSTDGVKPGGDYTDETLTELLNRFEQAFNVGDESLAASIAAQGLVLADLAANFAARPTVYTLHAPAAYVAWTAYPSSDTLGINGDLSSCQLVTVFSTYTQVRLLVNVNGNRLGSLSVRACDPSSFVGSGIDATWFTTNLLSGSSDLTVDLSAVSTGENSVVDSGWQDLDISYFTAGVEAVLGIIGFNGDDLSDVGIGSVVLMVR